MLPSQVDVFLVIPSPRAFGRFVCARVYFACRKCRGLVVDTANVRSCCQVGVCGGDGSDGSLEERIDDRCCARCNVCDALLGRRTSLGFSQCFPCPTIQGSIDSCAIAPPRCSPNSGGLCGGPAASPWITSCRLLCAVPLLGSVSWHCGLSPR